MERHHPRVGPHHPLVLRNQKIRPVRVLGESLGHEGHEAGDLVRPPVLHVAVPEGEVSQAPDPPRPVRLLDVLVLVQPALKPLADAARVLARLADVNARLHQRPEAALGRGARAVRGGGGVVDVHDALHLRVVEEEAVDGAVAPAGEDPGEAAGIETGDALLPQVAAAEELDVGLRVVGEEVGDLVQRLAIDLSDRGLSDRHVPLRRGTCLDSTHTCTAACGFPPGLEESVSCLVCSSRRESRRNATRTAEARDLVLERLDGLLELGYRVRHVDKGLTKNGQYAANPTQTVSVGPRSGAPLYVREGPWLGGTGLPSSADKSRWHRKGGAEPVGADSFPAGRVGDRRRRGDL